MSAALVLAGEVVSRLGLSEAEVAGARLASTRLSLVWLWDDDRLDFDSWTCGDDGRWRPPEGERRRECERPIRSGLAPDPPAPPPRGAGDPPVSELGASALQAALEDYRAWVAWWCDSADGWRRRHDARMAAVGMAMRRSPAVAACPVCGGSPCPAAVWRSEMSSKTTKAKAKTVTLSVDPHVHQALVEIGMRFLCGGGPGAAVRMLVEGLDDKALANCASAVLQTAVAARPAPAAAPAQPPAAETQSPPVLAARRPQAPPEARSSPASGSSSASG